MFSIKNVSKQYGGEFALNHVSLTIGRGLNFLTGASGSGKTTLLKIISGMEPDFDGTVSFCGKDLKTLSNREKSDYYNNVFGFIWQDFHLLEDLSVLENILLPAYLKDGSMVKEAEKILKSMKLSELAGQKVKYLSGGQKQRTAIARELMKNPQVIFADEPTSALDEKTSKEVMELLRMVAKTRSVIVVTHDTSFVTEKDRVIELDKGELVTPADESADSSQTPRLRGGCSLPFKNAITMVKTNIRRHIGRFSVSVLTLMTAAVLLMTAFSGAVSAGGKESFEKLFATYGETLLDISLVSSFTSAGGTDGGKDDKPKEDVSQDIGGLYEKYTNDSRVEFATFLQAFDQIQVGMDGKTYQIESSGSSPVIKKLLSGKMPEGAANEVVVPKYFLDQSGLTKEDILGKEIEFSSSIYNWDTGKPVLKDTKIKAVVSGVSDNGMVYEYEGKAMEYSVDDSFFFNRAALDEMRSQAGIQDNKINFLIRAKTPADMIALKDELNKNGIVPIGQFELVEDMVRLDGQTAEQSGSASAVIGLLAAVMVVAVFFVTNMMRKKEYAVYKISGFSTGHLCLVGLLETAAQAVAAAVLLFAASPLLSLATEALFHVGLLSAEMLLLGMALTFCAAVAAYAVFVAVSIKTNVAAALKNGGR